MRRRLIGVVWLGVCGSLGAEDLSGARNLLCAVVDSNVCVMDAGCAATSPEDLNVPRFIRVDTSSRLLSTTPASGEKRETKADSISRVGGEIILQGVEQSRAYSLFIHEATGEATFVSAADALSVSIFAACTVDSSR